MLRQLKRNGDVSGQIHRLTVARRWTESDLLRHTTRLFV